MVIGVSRRNLSSCKEAGLLLLLLVVVHERAEGLCYLRGDVQTSVAYETCPCSASINSKLVLLSPGGLVISDNNDLIKQLNGLASRYHRRPRYTRQNRSPLRAAER